MSHPVDQLAGQKLRARRKLLGLTQQDLADAVGVTFQQVQKYERGVNRISASRLADFARALQVPVGFFFENADGDVDYAANDSQPTALAEAASVYQADAFSNPETIELLKYFYRCSPNTRKKFIEMLKAMADDKPVID